MLCALKAVFLSQTTPARTRGVVLLVVATLILLAFDYDDPIKNVVVLCCYATIDSLKLKFLFFDIEYIFLKGLGNLIGLKRILLSDIIINC